MGSNGKLFLSQKRLHAINQAESNNYEVAILDDGLQDFSLDCDLEIVCFNNLNWKGNGFELVTTVWVVDIFTTDGINFSAKSAKEAGTFFENE